MFIRSGLITIYVKFQIHKQMIGVSKRKTIDDISNEVVDSDEDDDSQSKLKVCRPKKRRPLMSDDDGKLINKFFLNV